MKNVIIYILFMSVAALAGYNFYLIDTLKNTIELEKTAYKKEMLASKANIDAQLSKLSLDGSKSFLGKGINSYQLDTPENTVHSIIQMLNENDALALWQYYKILLQATLVDEFSGKDPSDERALVSLLISGVDNVSVEKIHKVKSSVNLNNNGIVLVFVSYVLDGVENRVIVTLYQAPRGLFVLAERSYSVRGYKKRSEEDNYIDKLITEWKIGAVLTGFEDVE